MALNITRFTTDVNNIQGLDDRPNESGISSQELKAKFDKAGSDIKSYLRDTMAPEIEDYINGLEQSLPTDYVSTSDSRLSNSRQCNNNFDTPLTARDNLKIKTGTSLPETVEEGCLFFLYS